LSTHPSPHALVVGGTRGIGLAVTRAFLDAGHRVTAIGRRTPDDPAFQHPGASFQAMDLGAVDGIEAGLEAVTQRVGLPDVIVFLQRYRGEEDAWNSELTTSLLATSRILDWLGPRLKPGEDHGIVLVGSMAGRTIAPEQNLVYHLAKAGLEQLARYYAVRFGPQGIRVNAVALGTVLKQESRAFYESHPELERLYAEATPLKRMGTAEEIAQSILFLCGPSASFITGQTLVVDGGMSLVSQEALARQISPLRDLPVTRPTGRNA